MVDTSVSGIPTLLDLGREVYGAFQTKKDNDEECKDLAGVLKSINRLLESLTQITRDKEQSLEQELQSLKEQLEKCGKFINKHGEKGRLKKIMFHQGEQDELKKLNTKLTGCFQRLHIAMDETLGKQYLEHFEKIQSNQREILRNQSKVSPSDETMFDRE